MQINLNQLRAFYMAARSGSMVAAAEQLFVSPPAVTMQIRKLENYVGCSLLHRRREGVVLTQTGRKVYRLAERIFTLTEQLEEELAKGFTGKEEIVVGMYHIPGQYIMPALLSHVSRCCPGLKIRFLLGDRQESFARIHSSTIHCALVGGEVAEPQLASQLLFHDRLVLICQSESRHFTADRISFTELSTMPLLMQQKNTGFYALLCQYLHQHQVEPDVLMEDISSDIIKQLVIEDHGLAFLVHFAAKEELLTGVFREIELEKPPPPVPFHLVYLARKKNRPELAAFLHCLHDFSFKE